MISLLLAATGIPHLTAPTITVSYPKTIMGQFTGRIFVFVSKDSGSEPRLGPTWWNPGPVFSVNVKQTKADTDIPVDDSDSSQAFDRLANLPAGDYTFQAVIERNPAAPRPGDGDGNLYSAPLRAHVESAGATVRLVCDQVIDEPTVHTSGTVKVVELESTPLSNAQRRTVIWRAVVVLPNEAATQPTHKFPILLDIPDRGDSYANYPSRDTNQAAYRDGKPFVYVRLDAESATGYHFMADSANNGPYAKALVEEFLPYVAKEYHGDLTHVLVSGTGAGGWSALWLQITKPTVFSGCWAIRPDSVDFHSLHGLNLYAQTNALMSESGAPLKWTRNGSESWPLHADVEKVLRGLWISGWESDFSPKGKNGRPMPLFDRVGGQVDPVVAKAWEAFDVDAYLDSNWASIGMQLDGKLNIFYEDADHMLSSDSTLLLRAELAKLGARASMIVLQNLTAAGATLPPTFLLDKSIAHAEAAACYPSR